MSGRITKRKSSNSHHSALADFILLNGTPSVMPCSRCHQAGVTCVMLKEGSGRSARCERCARDRKSCSGNSVAVPCPSSALFFVLGFLCCLLLLFLVTKALMEQRKARAAREKAEEELAELLGRVQRLRRQEEAWRKKGLELFERGMVEEDAVVADAEQRILDRQQAIGDAQVAGAFGLVDWDAIFAGVQVDPGSGGGTDPVPLGSPSGS